MKDLVKIVTESKEERTCSYCGCVDNDMAEIGLEWFCHDCYSVCDCCEENIPNDNLSWAKYGTNDRRLVCEECLEDSSNFFYCRDCEEWCHNDMYWGSCNGDAICEHCSDNYRICDGCECVFHIGDIYYHHATDQHLCDECYDEADCCSDIEDIVECYSYKPAPLFYGESNCNCYLGAELEVDNTDGSENNEQICNCARELQNNYSDYIYLKHDGSLLRGFEIVSHPMTLDFHTQKFDWDDVMQSCVDSTLRSHDTTSAGLHVHISRDFFGESEEEQDLHIAKLLLIVSKFFDSYIMKFSRRKAEELRWCSNPDVELTDTDTETTIVNKMKYSKSNGRYQAINLQNYNTVEFRIFKGTLKRSTFIAALQFVVAISEFAKSIKLSEIPSIQWKDIFLRSNYQELNNYLNKRGLN